MGTKSATQPTLRQEAGQEWRQGYRPAVQPKGLSDEGKI